MNLLSHLKEPIELLPHLLRLLLWVRYNLGKRYQFQLIYLEITSKLLEIQKLTVPTICSHPLL